MTTIFYDASSQILAVDSRRTHSHHGMKDSNDLAMKLHLIEGVEYKGEKVLAWAGCGNTRLLARALDIFVNHTTDEFLDTYQKARDTGFAVNTPLGVGFLFVTEKSVVTWDSAHPSQFTQSRSFVTDKFLRVAIGSGKAAAYQLALLFNVPAKLAVAAAELNKANSSGGTVSWVRFDKGKVVETDQYRFTSSDAIFDALKAHMASPDMKCNVYPRNLVASLTKPRPKLEKLTKPEKPAVAEIPTAQAVATAVKPKAAVKPKVTVKKTTRKKK
jgi:hypothetical protein